MSLEKHWINRLVRVYETLKKEKSKVIGNTETTSMLSNIEDIEKLIDNNMPIELEPDVQEVDFSKILPPMWEEDELINNFYNSQTKEYTEEVLDFEQGFSTEAKKQYRKYLSEKKKEEKSKATRAKLERALKEAQVIQNKEEKYILKKLNKNAKPDFSKILPPCYEEDIVENKYYDYV